MQFRKQTEDLRSKQSGWNIGEIPIELKNANIVVLKIFMTPIP